MSLFGAEALDLIPSLKEFGIPGSIVDQFVRSATSIGANYAEAHGAESRADFVHKLQTALKEGRETKHWLDVFQNRPQMPQRLITILFRECDQLCAILYSSVVTARRDGKVHGNGHSPSQITHTS